MAPKVFYISDGTAITAEVFGHAVLSAFPLKFESMRPLVSNTADVVNEIKLDIIQDEPSTPA